MSTDDRTDKAAPSQCRDRPGNFCNLATANEFHAEISRLRLTTAEREAVARSAAAWEADAAMGMSDGGVAATLRGLLERMR